MKRRLFVKIVGAATAAAFTSLIAGQASAQEKIRIALIPGLTADGFYVTMHHGAEAAAKAVGAELIYQGAAEWNVSLQVPVLDAVIAKKPHAILIAPTDKVQLIAPLKKAHDAGIAIVCVDTYIGTGVFQTGTGDADFPISYVASDNVLGGRMAARAGQSHRREGQGLCFQCEARNLDDRSARRRLQGRNEEIPRHRGSPDPVQR